MAPDPPDLLRRRNALWQQLRALCPGTPTPDWPATEAQQAEELVQELCALIGWERARVLRGLGLTEEEWPQPQGQAQGQPQGRA